MPLSPVIATPAPVESLIAPPEPAVVPLPVTVNVPAALLRLMPFVPPVALTLASVMARGAAAVAELSIATAVPAAAVIAPALIVSVPVWLVADRPVPVVALSCKLSNVIGALLPLSNTPVDVLPVTVCVPVKSNEPVLFVRLMPVAAPLIGVLVTVTAAELFWMLMPVAPPLIFTLLILAVPEMPLPAIAAPPELLIVKPDTSLLLASVTASPGALAMTGSTVLDETVGNGIVPSCTVATVCGTPSPKNRWLFCSVIDWPLNMLPPWTKIISFGAEPA